MTEDLDAARNRPELVAHPYRRRMLICLERHVTLSLADAAEELAVWAETASIADVPAEEVRDVYLALYHTHLPRLEHAGVVAYDQERDLVSLPGYGADAPVDVEHVPEPDESGETGSIDDGDG